MGIPRKYPPLETLDRIRKWCDLQERAHEDVRRKLAQWGVFGDETEEIIAELITSNYLNEERFARDFARGKFRMKGWGWKKIEAALKAKYVSNYGLQMAREEIDSNDYQDKLESLAQKKIAGINGKNVFEKKQKLKRFLVNKGFEYDIVHSCVEELFEAS